jgi:mono/diheme cytochrome c family protein
MTIGNTPASRRQPPVLGIVLGVVALIILAVVLFLVIRFLLPAQPPQFPAQGAFPQPARQTQQALISNYGWVSKPTGAARIPVERAMQIIATQGVPTLVEVPGQLTPQPTAAGGGNGPGAALFQSQGCIGCHTDQNGPIAPSLHGIYGKPVALEGGQTVTADDAYIKESILNPTAKVVKGFNPIMPSFQGKVTDDQISQLIDYIKTLK